MREAMRRKSFCEKVAVVPGEKGLNCVNIAKRCRMDVVTQSLLKEFAESQKIEGLGQSDQFEAFITI
jgi:hypothetical protein